MPDYDPDAPKGIFAEATEQAVEVELAQRNASRAFHYQGALLDDAGTPTRHAAPMLADLADFCRANESTFNADPRVHALLEGRREVFLRIINFLSIDSETVSSLVKVKDDG